MAADLARDDLELRRLVLRASLFPVLLMAALGGILVWQVLSLRNLSALVDRTDQVIGRVDVVTRLMIDHENALRGYLLTGREEFLAPYSAASTALDTALADLARTVADDPEQAARTRRLRALEEAWEKAAGELPRPAGPPSAAELAEGSIARKRILDEARAEAARFVEAEQQLRNERSARAEHASRVALRAAVPTLLLLGVLLAVLARRQIRRVATLYQTTSRAAAQRADLLAESEERFRLFVEGLRDAAVFVLDTEGYVRSWNVGAERIKRYRPDEIIGQHFSVFYVPEEASAGIPARELAEALARGQLETEGWRVRKGGSRFWAAVTLRALRGADGRLLGYAKLVRDTTERKRAEMRRAAQYVVARALVDAPSFDEALIPLLGGVGSVLGYEVALAWMQDGDALRLAASWHRPSPEAEELVERIRARRLGRGERMAGQAWSSRVAVWVADGRMDPDVELARVAADSGLATGLAFPVRVSGPAGDRQGMVIQLLAKDPRERDPELLQLAATLGVQIGAYLERYAAEQEERAAAERRSEELERRVRERTVELTAVNDELEAFSYSVSHDLRAPLRAMDGFSQVLLEDYGDRLDSTGRDYLGRIREASQRMSRLIDDLIQLSRVTRADIRRDEVDLSTLVRDVTVELREREPGRQVEVAIAAGIRARGDARLLRAGLVNLLANAFKYTRDTPRPCVEFGVREGGDGPAYYVRDNGVGFDMTYASRLFQPFQRLHGAAEFEGSGIGLATWQRIVRRHGGRVWAESSPGNGATFWFTLGEY